MNELIDQYIDILTKWNQKINLIQKNSLNNVIERHIKDSEQISQMLEVSENIIDIGSGAGFPGIILAINNFKNITLCEKNIKKVSFLRYVKSELELNFDIFDNNIYNFKKENFTIISRAFGSLSNLLSIMIVLKSKKGIFHKGERYNYEIVEAKQKYNFDYYLTNSITNKKSVIINITNVKRKKWEK